MSILLTEKKCVYHKLTWKRMEINDLEKEKYKSCLSVCCDPPPPNVLNRARISNWHNKFPRLSLDSIDIDNHCEMAK